MDEGVRYKDKVTIVTGGSSGIGKGCAAVFVRHGSKVVFCSNNEAQGKEAEEELNKIGNGEATFIFADVTKEEDIQNLVKKTVETYGKIDCVINNAGWPKNIGKRIPEQQAEGIMQSFTLNSNIDPPYTRIDITSADDFISLLKLNVVGYFLVSKYALPHLRKTTGNIINVSSVGGHTGDGFSVGYDTSKGAVGAMTRAIAIDEAKYNVRCNAISPGSIVTPLGEEFINKSPDPEGARQMSQDVSVLGRQGTPEECGMTCLYLAADATFCTGVDILVTGGTSLNLGCKNMKRTDVWPTCYAKVL